MYGLQTDAKNPVEHTEAGKLDLDDDAVKNWRKRDAEKLGKHGGHRVDDPKVNGHGANCHGTTFDRGCSDIPEAQVRIILRDNYAKLHAKTETDRQRCSVCDIVIYGSPDAPRHSALIVEVDEKGYPKTVVGKNGTDGELWAHPPDDFGDDWEAYTRTHTDELDKATRDEIDKLRDDYNKAKAKYDADKSDANRDAMHKAGYELCRRKNALTRV
jgi:hypothetical protein